MFNPEKEVPNLELCKKLKELGFPQDGGGWYWTQTDTGWRLGYCAEYNLAPKVKIHMMFFAELGRVIFRVRHKIIKAPTITEMWNVIPDNIPASPSYLIAPCAGIIIYKKVDMLKVTYQGRDDLDYFIDKPANALAKLILWLNRNRYIDFTKEHTNEQRT